MTCYMSHVTSHLSLMPKATDPPPAGLGLGLGGPGLVLVLGGLGLVLDLGCLGLCPLSYWSWSWSWSW